MKNFWAFIAFFMMGLTSMGQSIFFCSNYTTSGEPIGTATVWNINPTGGNVYLIYQDKANLSSDKMLVSVEKLSGNDYVPFDVKSVDTDKSKKWFVYDMHFPTAGDYKVTIKDGNNREFAKNFVTIQLKENVSTNNNDPKSTFYYTNSSVTTGTNIDATSGILVSPSTSFTIDRTNGGVIYFKVDNLGKALETSKITVYIDKMSTSGKYEEFDTKVYTISNKSRSWIYFTYDFFTEGSYKVSVYNESLTFINTSYLTLTYRN